MEAKKARGATGDGIGVLCGLQENEASNGGGRGGGGRREEESKHWELDEIRHDTRLCINESTGLAQSIRALYVERRTSGLSLMFAIAWRLC